MKIINWELAKNPLNWVIVFLMVFIAGLAIHFVTEHVQIAAIGGPLNAASARASSPGVSTVA
jgi:hypothetical protein